MAPESGAQKRKRRQREKQLIESQRGSFHKFLKTNTSTSRNPDELALVLMGKQNNIDPGDNGSTEDDVHINADDDNVSNHDDKFANVDDELEPVSVDIYNPAN
jgi:hypothetical protein